MATIRKRGSSYRIEKMYKGERYSLTIDHKPTKSEADRLIWELIESTDVSMPSDSFEAAAEDYIKSKDYILSPATIRGYRSMLKNLPHEFKNARLKAVDRKRVQILLNDVSKHSSPKSVRNLSGFISAVIKSVNPDWNNNVTLPQKKAEEFYVPEKEDVKKILDAARGTRWELPLRLATFGLRRSEILALETSDLKDNKITVNKALVPDGNKHMVLKTTKTTDSTREVPVSPYVADLIRALPDGRIYNGHPDSILNYLHKTQDRLNIPRFKLHYFRHFFASTARESMGDVYVEDMGGWKKGSSVMKKVYDYAQKKEAEKHQEEFAKRMGSMFD